MTTFSGTHGINVFQCLTIASGLTLYAKTKMKPNRAYTPSAMMKAASQITGKKFKSRDYLGAAAALKELAEKEAILARAKGQIS